MAMTLPEKVNHIIHSLTDAGFEAYAVGGCVRDMLLGREPKDYDITTSARPEEVKKIFRRTIDTGIKHGTVTVMTGKEGYEVTTYRLDGNYGDGRHPDSVTFTPSLEEDLKRRDFTINAMAFNEENGLVDIFGGEEDIKNRIIRCVGNPDRRFDEDALRIMRAVRFSAQLSFDIEENTRRSVARHAYALKKISAERIRDELVKILISDDPGKIRELYELGITKVILPEFDRCMHLEQTSKYHVYSVGEHIIKTIEAIEPDTVLRFTMLFHDMGKPAVRTKKGREEHFKGHQKAGAQLALKVMKRLKFDNDTMHKVSTLVFYHDFRPIPSESDVRRAIHKIGSSLFIPYLQVQRADAAGKNPAGYEKELKRTDEILEIFETVTARGDCIDLKGLAVNGSDLIAHGIEPGVQIGKILNSLLELVIADQSYNEKEILLREAERIMKEI